jgi:cysteinyl-tRNA synthetase
MSTQHLGNNFDIHGGGHDLQLPHHENEIAQSEAGTGEHYANYWMHNGFIRINEEKMSKSLNNFFTIRDVLKTHKAEAIRYFMLTSHYRSPLNYSTEQLDNANTALDRLYTALRDIPITEALTNSDYEVRFHLAMKDDFNTPEALAVLFELVRESNRLQQSKDKTAAAPTAALLKKLAQLLGLLKSNSEDWFKTSSYTNTNELSNTAIETLIAKRTTAKRNKQWQEADEIRNQLQKNDIILEDTADGSCWKRK